MGVGLDGKASYTLWITLGGAKDEWKEGRNLCWFFGGGRGWKIQLDIPYRLQKDPGAESSSRAI